MVAEQNSVKPETETAVQTAISNAEHASVDSFSVLPRYETKTLVKAIRDERENQTTKLAFLAFADLNIVPIIGRCSNTLRVDLCAGIPYFYIYNREDLGVLMTLAPLWSKYKETKSISYCAKVGGVDVYLKAYDNALPPTCRVVKTTVLVPAQEAHEVTQETIVCEVGA